MDYVSQELEDYGASVEVPILIDPSLLRAARRIYRTYCVLHAKLTKRPLWCGNSPKFSSWPAYIPR